MIHQNEAQVKIRGIGEGILLHSPAGLGSHAKSAKRIIPSPEEEAEAGCYWTEDHSSLAFPATNLWCGLIQAASGYKVPGYKKLSLSPVLAGDMSISPRLISFGTKEYRIDTRRAVIQRQGVLRSRPWLPEWELTFQVHWESQFLGLDFHQAILPDLLERLGKTIGIGDFRPARKGPFGRFEVVEIVG